jgi:hypothetical protein
MRAIQAITKINPLASAMFEQFLFKAASDYISAYNGGSWTSSKFGKFWIALPPLDNNTVKMENVENCASIETSLLSAGAVLTLKALNDTIWYVHGKFGERADTLVNRLSDLYHSMKDAITADSKTFDTASIAMMID